MTVGYTHSRHHIGDVDEETQTMYYRGFNELTTWSQNPVETIEEDVLHAYHDAVYSATRNRRIFWTLGGSHGLGPLCMRQDDIVVVLYGYEYPLVLRTRGDGYLILGEEYIGEIMRGELVEEMEQGRRQEQIFCLI
ncbi:HET-domain-containing protein [Pyrenophora tritici-repentis]|nr:HET-domain-containing protein [Pyrenophora tritici-repentis]